MASFKTSPKFFPNIPALEHLNPKLKTPSTTCNDYNQDPYCLCPSGQRISVFKSHHHNPNEDRIWQLECAPIQLVKIEESQAKLYIPSKYWNKYILYLFVFRADWLSGHIPLRRPKVTILLILKILYMSYWSVANEVSTCHDMSYGHVWYPILVDKTINFTNAELGRLKELGISMWVILIIF